MCDECLDGYLEGAVLAATSPEQVAAAGLIVWVYEQDWGGVGGPLHCIADDHNLDDEYFEDPVLIHEPWAITLYSDIPVDGKERCERVYALLKPMTVAQRAQTMQLVDSAQDLTRRQPATSIGGEWTVDTSNWTIDPEKRLSINVKRPK